MSWARARLVAVVVLTQSEVHALKLGGLVGNSKEPKQSLGGLLGNSKPKQLHVDLLVIGGGSGGLAASKAAAELGKRVAVCNFVKPSPQGTTWGLGGTCVNVGCIPKKLMHHAAQLGELRKDSIWYGWEVPDDAGEEMARTQFLVPEAKHSWEVLVKNVQNYIKSSNFAYKAQCRSNSVEYLDAFASFTGPKTVEAVTKAGAKTTITADAFVVSVGGRPRYLEIPGALEHCITSDDLFSLKQAPGKTLVIGGGYVALECAGVLRGIGFETKVLMRSVPLRGFDQQMAEHVVRYMEEEEGIAFHRDATPQSVEGLEDGRKRVTWQQRVEGEMRTCVEDFDTVLLAVGRDAYTHKMGLEKAGVERNAHDGKIRVRHEQTNVPHIYAIGDVIDGSALSPPSSLTELTPVAIQAGQLLAARLYGESERQMDYQKVPTTVFTPLEYGMVGLSEEAAIDEYGEEHIEVYHQYFKPLEWKLTYPRRSEASGYAKLICHTADASRVVGLHVCGPSAGEMTQGFAVAMRCGATKDDFDSTVGIHPTTVETFMTMSVTKRSGRSAQATAC